MEKPDFAPIFQTGTYVPRPHQLRKETAVFYLWGKIYGRAASEYCVYKISIVRNHVKLGISLRVRYVRWMLAMGLADLWEIADLHCRKVQSTKWLKHKLCHVRRPIV